MTSITPQCKPKCDPPYETVQSKRGEKTVCSKCRNLVDTSGAAKRALRKQKLNRLMKLSAEIQEITNDFWATTRQVMSDFDEELYALFDELAQ